MNSFNHKKAGGFLLFLANILYLSTAPFAGIETPTVHLVKVTAGCIAFSAILIFLHGRLTSRREVLKIKQ